MTYVLSLKPSNQDLRTSTPPLMLRRLCLASVFSALVISSGHGQTLKEYIASRNQLGIKAACEVSALDVLIGTKTIEIAGVIKGSFAINGKTTYLLERIDGSTVDIECVNPISWLQGSEVHCRLLIRATRLSETSALHAQLLGAAPEADIARLEALSKPKTPTKIKYPTSKPPLSGPIGKGSPVAANWNVSQNTAVMAYASYIKSYNKRLSDSQAILIAQGIIGFAQRYAVDARLIMAMVLVESGFNPDSRSGPGAMGLGQLMPGTAASLGITNAYDPMQNLYGTTRVIRGHMERYKKITGNDYESLILALAAYNSGSGTVRRNGYQVPPYRETQNYIRKVISTYKKFLGY